MFVYQQKNYKSIRELAKEVKIPYTTLLHRLDNGKTLEEAISQHRELYKPLNINGRIFSSITDAAKFFKLRPGTVSARLRNGWSPEEAVGLIKRKRERKTFKAVTKNPVRVKGVIFPSLFAAARHFGLSANMVNKRVKNNGLTIEQALELDPFPEWFTPGKGKHSVTQKLKRIEKEAETGLKMCSSCEKEKPLTSFQNSNEKDKQSRCRDCVSAAFLRYRYKISVNDFWKLYTQQKGCCAICGVNFNLSKETTWRPKSAVIDHCHESGKVRGILCSLCNTGLGSFKDDINFLSNAVQYLNATR